ncbi:MAG: autotransporter outer membrane beta-barrel domain-containing protein, partial [Salinisphaera sp.]|nr:autotransporter outer membrane beta-barrel domain-containing protein [Salinisphaera sp.]
YGITVGADYRLNQNLVLGTALNYIAYKSEFATFAGEADQTGYSLSGLPPARAWSGSGHGARPGRDRYANRGAGVNRFGWPARSWRVWVAAAAVCAQRKKGATKCT